MHILNFFHRINYNSIILIIKSLFFILKHALEHLCRLETLKPLLSVLTFAAIGPADLLHTCILCYIYEIIYIDSTELAQNNHLCILCFCWEIFSYVTKIIPTSGGKFFFTLHIPGRGPWTLPALKWQPL